MMKIQTENFFTALSHGTRNMKLNQLGYCPRSFGIGNILLTRCTTFVYLSISAPTQYVTVGYFSSYKLCYIMGG